MSQEILHQVELINRDVQKHIDTLLQKSDQMHDLGRKLGRREMAYEVGLTIDIFETNINNEKLSDAEFREFAKTIAERLREVTSPQYERA